MASEIKNARIEQTFLGIEDHGIPTFILAMSYGGVSQAFGNYDLRFYGHDMLMRVMKTVGVDSWEKLKGSLCRVRAEHTKVHAIGHIIDDVWYCPEDEAPSEALERAAK